MTQSYIAGPAPSAMNKQRTLAASIEKPLKARTVPLKTTSGSTFLRGDANRLRSASAAPKATTAVKSNRTDLSETPKHAAKRSPPQKHFLSKCIFEVTRAIQASQSVVHRTSVRNSAPSIYNEGKKANPITS